MHPLALEQYIAHSNNLAKSSQSSLDLDNPDDIKKLALQLNQFLRKKGITESKQSLLLEGISQSLGFNSWNSCQGTLKNRQQSVLNLEELIWDVKRHNYQYNYQHQILKIRLGSEHFETTHYLCLSLQAIEKIIVHLDYLQAWFEMGVLPVNNQSAIHYEGNLRYGIRVKDEQSPPWFFLEPNTSKSDEASVLGNESSTFSLVIKNHFKVAVKPFLAIIHNRPGRGKPRDMSALKQLDNLSELLAFMQADPLDRVLWSSDDLGPDDWADGYSTRNDTSCLVVMSMKALNAQNIEDLVQKNRSHGYDNAPRPGEIAVIGHEALRTSSGREIPWDINKMIRDVDNGVQGLPLAGHLYEGVWVLSSHPEAKKRSE